MPPARDVRSLGDERLVRSDGPPSTGRCSRQTRTARPARPAAARDCRRPANGSYEAGSFAGNAFPSTSWVADNPVVIDPASYRLRVDGLVAHPLAILLGELPAADELVATLDCTGGFYSTQRWRGIRLGGLLDLTGADPGARHVTFGS